jgi:hypothetical protein
MTPNAKPARVTDPRGTGFILRVYCGLISSWLFIRTIAGDIYGGHYAGASLKNPYPDA